MLSALFRRDYAQMRGQGVEFTPEDIVRLNALAVKIRLSQHAPDTVHLPRVAFLGKLILREPTIAHELWLEEAARWIDVRDDRNYLWLHGYALSRPAAKLVDALRPEKTLKAVYRFAARELCTFTREQLSAAVEYALFGADWTIGEAASEHGKKESEPSSPVIGLLVRARALRLPITIEDARRMTASELDGAINRALRHDGEIDLEAMRNRATKEYVRAREEIRERATPVKASESDRQPTTQKST